MNKKEPTKAELIEELCSTVLDKEKVNKKHAEIIMKRNQVIIKIKKRIIGHVVECNGMFNFQYYIL